MSQKDDLTTRRKTQRRYKRKKSYNGLIAFGFIAGALLTLYFNPSLIFPEKKMQKKDVVINDSNQFNQPIEIPGFHEDEKAKPKAPTVVEKKPEPKIEVIEKPAETPEAISKKQAIANAIEALEQVIKQIPIVMPDTKILLNSGDLVYGKMQSENPHFCMIKTLDGEWKIYKLSTDYEEVIGLGAIQARDETQTLCIERKAALKPDDSDGHFNVAEICAMTNQEELIPDLLRKAAEADSGVGVRQQDKYARHLFAKALWHLGKNQAGATKKKFRELIDHYPYSSMVPSAREFLGEKIATRLVANAEKVENKKPAKANLNWFEARQREAEKAQIDIAETTPTGKTKKPDIYFKKAMKIYQTLDPAKPDYKKKNKQSLKLFNLAFDGYRKAAAKSPNDEKLQSRLQKCAMLRYATWKMSTI